MMKLVSDRRLYLTEDGDQVVEEGDARARFLLVGAGGTISAAEVERLELTAEERRIRYPGAPSLEGPGSGEDRASEVKEPKKELIFGGDKTGGRGKIDPPPETTADASVGEGSPGEDAAAGAEVVDHSDRNNPGPPPEWPGRMSVDKYLERYPTGPKAELARAVVAAREDGADGAP